MSNGRGAASSPDNPQEEIRRAMEEAQRNNRHLEATSIEMSKARSQKEFNEMYKKRLKKLESDSKQNFWMFVIATSFSIIALFFSIINIL